MDAKADLNERLRKLVKQAPVMLFMKGIPQEPKCGFSRKIVEALNKDSIVFDSFNILNDNEVREGLKTFSNWPTYPQLYVKGELMGGLDIVVEMQQNGELLSVIPPDCIKKAGVDPNALKKRLEAVIHKAAVTLFMKGTPDAPRCGFSAKIVKILKDNAVQFDSFDILVDEEVRQGLKTYSNWPTYPQLYSKGKFIGGLDIVAELAENGELLDSLK